MKSMPVLLFCVFLISGCMSLPQAINADPLKIKNIGSHVNKGDVIGTASFSANRRTVLVSLVEGRAGKFCAEPPPGVTDNLTATSNRELTSDSSIEGIAQGETGSTFLQTVVAMPVQTVILDIYRTAVYSLCQYHLNGALPDKDLIREFSNLTDKTLNSLVGH